ncbi:MAG TPA: SRPBCC family protein [Bryobacteraceae bacterium]|jgi:uncharacterized protein YndB with AHSA1/START domain
MAPSISHHHQPDPELDLVLERILEDVPPASVWAAWTTPDQVVKWFTPAPWKTVECQIDLRPGGEFRTVMCSPEGQSFPNIGCYLEIVENEKLVFTNALAPGFRPAAADLTFTAIVILEPHGESGTKYTAIAMHANPETRKRHEDMGFHTGWGAALDQLVAVAKAA